MNNVRDIQKLNELELERGLVDKASWHDQFKSSAYIHVGGLSFDLTEGDLLAIFSQYGEIVDLDLVRDKVTGKSKGFAFIGYEDQRSTVLTVDNLNGSEILGRIIKVDHTLTYEGRRPGKNEDEAEFAEKERQRKLLILPPHLKPRIEGDPSSEEEEEEEEVQDRPDQRRKESNLHDPMSSYLYEKNLKKEKKRERKEAKKAKKEKRKREEEGEGLKEKRDKRSRSRDRRYRSRSRSRERDRNSRDERGSREERDRREERDGSGRREDRYRSRSRERDDRGRR